MQCGRGERIPHDRSSLVPGCRSSRKRVVSEESIVSESEAFRTCPYCAAQDVPKLVVYPRLMSGSATNWRCRACDRTWSDSQTAMLRAS